MTASLLALELSPAVLVVAKLRATGLNVAEIAALLRKSPNTVKVQLSKAYGATGSRNSVELMRKLRGCDA